MTRTTITKLILTLLGGIFLFSTTFSKSVHAEENNESTQILKELYLSISEDYKAFWDDVDYYVEIDENNIPSLNIKEFIAHHTSDTAYDFAFQMHSISVDIKNNGLQNTVDKMNRWLFPIGAYGNYCGKGNKGWNKKPIDDLDSACREHDKCFKGFFKNNDKCNRDFIRKLLPIIQANPGTKKGIYAMAAAKLFSFNM
ncbi:phospholipase A2 family protein [Enterococcus cecorum]|uniref:Phospholipase n=1 Tax=Enterococcus cecorum TaxID=44008 RepID=A0A7X9NP90_9ENTE|nr:phospholipase A2 family protein [Enterococcus cecorum]NME50441.1 phospholipase [Enterococcus cecorum]STP83901.1 Phospholipase A2 [Enterococcus cecorum]